jgi:hypothetical protein
MYVNLLQEKELIIVRKYIAWMIKEVKIECNKKIIKLKIFKKFKIKVYSHNPNKNNYQYLNHFYLTINQ